MIKIILLGMSILCSINISWSTVVLYGSSGKRAAFMKAPNDHIYFINCIKDSVIESVSDIDEKCNVKNPVTSKLGIFRSFLASSIFYHPKYKNEILDTNLAGIFRIGFTPLQNSFESMEKYRLEKVKYKKGLEWAKSREINSEINRFQSLLNRSESELETTLKTYDKWNELKNMVDDIVSDIFSDNASPFEYIEGSSSENIKVKFLMANLLEDRSYKITLCDKCKYIKRGEVWVQSDEFLDVSEAKKKLPSDCSERANYLINVTKEDMACTNELRTKTSFKESF